MDDEIQDFGIPLPGSGLERRKQIKIGINHLKEVYFNSPWDSFLRIEKFTQILTQEEDQLFTSIITGDRLMKDIAALEKGSI